MCLITVAVGNPLHFLSSRLRGCDGVWSFEEILTDNVHGCFVRNVSSYLELSKRITPRRRLRLRVGDNGDDFHNCIGADNDEESFIRRLH